MELPIYAWNASLAMLALVLLFWLISLLVRSWSLLVQRRMIEAGRVVVLSSEDPHPEWLERAYVARLVSRQARAVPSQPVDTLHVPVSSSSLLFSFFFLLVLFLCL